MLFVNRSYAIIVIVVALLLIGGGITMSHLQGSVMTPVPSPTVDATTCPSEITAADTGRTITCHVGNRFTIHLNQGSQPIEHLSCEPKGNLGIIASQSPTDSDEYTVQFEGVRPGTCTMHNDSFDATIAIVS